jgi:hypothetical protein
VRLAVLDLQQGGLTHPVAGTNNNPRELGLESTITRSSLPFSPADDLHMVRRSFLFLVFSTDILPGSSQSHHGGSFPREILSKLFVFWQTHMRKATNKMNWYNLSSTRFGELFSWRKNSKATLGVNFGRHQETDIALSFLSPSLLPRHFEMGTC